MFRTGKVCSLVGLLVLGGAAMAEEWAPVEHVGRYWSFSAGLSTPLHRSRAASVIGEPEFVGELPLQVPETVDADESGSARATAEEEAEIVEIVRTLSHACVPWRSWRLGEP